MEEEKKYKDIELRSEEVQEVMNHISPWVVRCGITVLALILLMILVGCWIFRYPDTLAAEVTLATEEPPAFVLSHATGKLDTLYVKNGSLVSTDADLGVIGNAASSEDVRFLKERMKAWEAQDYDWREGVEFFAGRRWQLGGTAIGFCSFHYFTYRICTFYGVGLLRSETSFSGKTTGWTTLLSSVGRAGV